MKGAQCLWDLDDDPDGNVQHILVNGISKDEVDEVMADGNNPTAKSRWSDKPVTFGWTSNGKHIAVIFDKVEEGLVYPLTAFEVPEPRSRRHES